MTQTAMLIEAAERRAQSLRPATFTYGNLTCPCTPGNLEFFERLKLGGFEQIKNLQIRMLRRDVGDTSFDSGDICTVTDQESGDVFQLTIGENNSTQAQVIILNVEKTPA